MATRKKKTTAELRRQLIALHQKQRDDLSWRREVGQCFNALYPATEERRAYRRDFVIDMAKELGHTPAYGTTLIYCRRFYLWYTAADIKRLEAGGLSWTHVKHLLEVPNKQERERLERRADKEKWSCDELWRAVQEKYGVRTHGGGQRKALRVTGQTSALRQLQNRAARAAGDLADLIPTALKAVPKADREQIGKQIKVAQKQVAEAAKALAPFCSVPNGQTK